MAPRTQCGTPGKPPTDSVSYGHLCWLKMWVASCSGHGHISSRVGTRWGVRAWCISLSAKTCPCELSSGPDTAYHGQKSDRTTLCALRCALLWEFACLFVCLFVCLLVCLFVCCVTCHLCEALHSTARHDFPPKMQTLPTFPGSDRETRRKKEGNSKAGGKEKGEGEGGKRGGFTHVVHVDSRDFLPILEAGGKST